jgi:hypothetical protein
MGRRRHHFIPQFYLKRWAVRPNAKLVRYIKDFRGNVVLAERSPKSVGFEWDLYKLPGAPPGLEHQVEDIFMQQVDNRAATIMAKIIDFSSVDRLNVREKSIIARLILSFTLRNPQSVRKLTERINNDWHNILPDQEMRYKQEIWRPGFPDYLADYEIEVFPNAPGQASLRILRNLIENRKVRKLISEMFWKVIDVGLAKRPLVTSDRPVVMTDGFGGINGHLILPISPRSALAAATFPAALNQIAKLSPDKLVRELNRKVIGQAVREVYSVDNNQAERVKKHMSTLTYPSWM